MDYLKIGKFKIFLQQDKFDELIRAQISPLKNQCTSYNYLQVILVKLLCIDIDDANFILNPMFSWFIYFNGVCFKLECKYQPMPPFFAKKC